MKQSFINKYIVVCLLTFLSPFIGLAKNIDKDFIVVIDAGHGGKDHGACDNGAKEKDINLAVALQLESIMKKKMKDTQVVMTRNNDKYLTLQERADIANKAKGDLFISIHTNSVDKSNKNRKTVSGSSVYVLGLHKDENNMKVAQRENSVIELESNYEQKYSGFDPSKDESYIIFEMAQKKNLSKSIRFAENVQKEFVGIGRGNRGVHQAGFWVLWATSMPAVLVELDFICNPGAAQYMTSEKGQKAFAQAIFNAVDKYYESWKNSKGNSSKTAFVDDMPKEEFTAAQLVDSYGADGGDYTPVLLGSAQSVEKKKANAPKKAKGNHSSMRRRRSEASKTISDNKSFETDAIPLHKEHERGGALIARSEQPTMASSSASDNLSQTDKKNKKAKTKKDKKSKEKTENKKRDRNSHNAKIEKFVTVYKIQILASADLLKQNNSRFCGLSPISTYKENNTYKYFYGESPEREEIEELLKTVKTKIPDAFIVSSKKSMSSVKK